MERLNIIPYPNKVEFLADLADMTKVVKNITEKIIPGSMGDEAYTLEINEDSAFIKAATPKGVFYARKTIEQLALENEIPCCRIEDKPAFPYRGFMVDCVRHIVSIEDTKKLIDAAASAKMNAMHWHLSDDQGWRVQIDSRPALMSEASMRNGSHFGRESDETEYGCWFTKDEIKEVVDYAAERFIDVIPEIDMPGHMSALIHAYPEVSCRGEKIDVKMKQGVFPDILCAGKDETFELIFDIIDELCELFPCEYFHIGGDEAPKKYWSECPDCKKRRTDNGLKTDEELQGWFVEKIRAHLEEKGKKAVVWNESLKSGKVKDVSVQYWLNDKAAVTKYANNGGRVIISDYFHYYLDYPYAVSLLKNTYKFNPYIKGLNAEGKKNVAGVECPTWTEYIHTFDKYCYMTFPRLTAVAETGWTFPENKDEKDFERRFLLYTEILKSYGVTPAPQGDWFVPVLKRFKIAKDFYAPILK